MKPIFIALLEHGEEKALKGTSLAEVIDWAEKNEYLPAQESPDHNIQKGLLRDLFFEAFEQNSFVSSSANSWGLKAEYYFRLIEYRELSEARANSRKAQRNAIAAISISVIAVLVSLGIGFMQLNSSVKLSKSQFTELLESIGEN